MSKLRAVITMFVLGSSSLAMADSTFTASARASIGAPVRDHRVAPAYERPVFARGTWISLAEPMQLGARTVVTPTSQARMNQIRVQSTAGSTFVSKVTVRYVDGSRQAITLNQWVDARTPIAQFNLDRTAQIDKILINGSAKRRGKSSVQVFGYGTTERPTRPMPERDSSSYLIDRLSTAELLSFDGTNRIAVKVAPSITTFGNVRLEATAGTSYVNRLLVRFANGQESVIELNRTLAPGQQLSLGVDSSRPIASIVITTDRSTRGQLALTAW